MIVGIIVGIGYLGNDAYENHLKNVEEYEQLKKENYQKEVKRMEDRRKYLYENP